VSGSLEERSRVVPANQRNLLHPQSPKRSAGFELARRAVKVIGHCVH
jgi:hypothetical protein